MGWKSTLCITREDAIAELLGMLENPAGLNALDDETLSRVLEAVNDAFCKIGWGLNFSIVPAYVQRDEWGEPSQYGYPEEERSDVDH